MSAFVNRILQVKGGIRFQVIPLALLLKIVVMKFMEEIVTETASIATAKPPKVTPGWGLN